MDKAYHCCKGSLNSGWLSRAKAGCCGCCSWTRLASSTRVALLSRRETSKLCRELHNRNSLDINGFG